MTRYSIWDSYYPGPMRKQAEIRGPTGEECPWCRGDGMVWIDAQPIEMEDLANGQA